jgi:hypothetical protein
MRARGILALLLVAMVAAGALVFAIGTLALTAVDFLSRTGPAPTIEDADLGTLQVYDVLADATLDPLPSGLGATVWTTYVRIVGAEYAGETMSTFQTGSNADSDTLAYVIRADGDVHRWDLAANLAYSDDQSELIATLVHEYAHILSLNEAEVAPFAKTCDTLDLDEGCADADSYIVAFEREFWADYGDDAPDATNVDDEVTAAFYADHEEDFVGEYAATNVVEDFAESFMVFVIEPLPDDGDTPTARKLLFFSDYPELAAIRDRVRAEFEGEF